MRSWANLLGYQAAWFIAVGCAARGLAWPGIAACLGFAAVAWWHSPLKRGDAWLAGVALGYGLLLDGVLAASGWLGYAAPVPALPAPTWIVALWVAFAMTLRHSLRWVLERPVIAVLFGAIGGPLAYWGAGRGFNAVVFVMPLQATLMLALGWAVAMATFVAVARASTAAAFAPEASA